MSRAKLIELSRRALDGDEAAVASLRTEDVDVPDEALLKRAQNRINKIEREAFRVPFEKPKAGFKAYTGSPYRFSEFDREKIGRGEGAQMYGEGFYLTETTDSARPFRRNINRDRLEGINDRLSEISKELPKYEIAGMYREFNDPKGFELAGEYDRLMDERSGLSDFNITVGGKDINDLYSDLTGARATDLDYQKAEIIEQIMIDGDTLGVVQRQEEYDAYPEGVYKWFKETIQPNFDAPGALYEVTIKADKSELLDWNKPVSDQPPAIRDALLAKGIKEATAGKNAYYELAKDAKGPDAQKKATEAAEALGIKGIQYEDPYAQAGAKNFVIFDPRTLDIATRYGIALPMAGLMLANQEAEAAESMALTTEPRPPMRVPTFENDDATGKVLDARQGADLSPYDRAMMKAQAQQEPMTPFEAIPARAERFAREVTIPAFKDIFG